MDPAETITDTELAFPRAPLGAGRALGEFTLVERVGSGAFGDVWRARQAGLDREAAVKIPHATHLARPELVERFHREARLAARLDHPFAAHVYGWGTEPDGVTWIAMEFVRGEPLSGRLARAGAMPLAEAVAFLTEVAHVVAAAHARGIVHRDLKPSNVLVVEEAGRVWPKLLDFGIAREAPAAGEGLPSADDNGASDAEKSRAEAGGAARIGDRTAHGARLGSHLYMAPEQWRDAHSADARSDQYALGIVAYEVLTGQAPFRATTLQGIADAHARQPLPSLGPRFPRGLDAVLTRATAKRPEDRFPDVEQLARAIEAAAATTPQAGGAMFRVPAATTAFIGRDAERAAVAAAIVSARLVTVVGAGGAGKTRLSLQVAADVASQFTDGVCVVELLEVHTPDELAPAVARTLGVDDPTLAGLRGWLAARRMLLVLDNCEHVVEAAAQLTHALLRASPGLRVLATSREPLGVAGETTWPLPPMAVPSPAADVEAALQADAVRLFAGRARAADPTFVLTEAVLPAVVAICRRLDGIPLAIELAAARVRALPPAALAVRLQSSLAALGEGPRAGVPHHRTLRAAIEWGHALLTDAERTAFRRLTVLPGPFSLDVAAVAVDGPDDDDVVLRLLDRSMVTTDGAGRLRLLETLREYGLEQLDDARETHPTRARLLRWLRDEARREARQPYTLDAPAYHHRWSARTELIADLVARAPGLGEIDVALELVAELWRHWEIMLPSGEIRVATAALLAAGADLPHRLRLRGRAWEAYGAMRWRAGDLQGSGVAHREAAARARAAGDSECLAFALFGMAGVLIPDDPAGAHVVLREARELADRLDDDRIQAYVHHHLAVLALREDRLDDAEASLREAERWSQARGDRHGSLVNRYHLALITRRRGHRARARWEVGQILLAGPEACDVEAVAECLEILAAWLLEDDLPTEAARWEAAAQAIREECGDPLTPAEAAAHADRITRARDRLGDAAFRAAWGEGAAYDLAGVLAAFEGAPAP